MKYVVFRKTASDEEREILGVFDNSPGGSRRASELAKQKTLELGGEWAPDSPGTIVGELGDRKFICKKFERTPSKWEKAKDEQIIKDVAREAGFETDIGSVPGCIEQGKLFQENNKSME